MKTGWSAIATAALRLSAGLRAVDVSPCPPDGNNLVLSHNAPRDVCTVVGIRVLQEALPIHSPLKKPLTLALEVVGEVGNVSSADGGSHS